MDNNSFGFRRQIWSPKWIKCKFNKEKEETLVRTEEEKEKLKQDLQELGEIMNSIRNGDKKTKLT